MLFQLVLRVSTCVLIISIAHFNRIIIFICLMFLSFAFLKDLHYRLNINKITLTNKSHKAS